jgi:hypothetical protein
MAIWYIVWVFGILRGYLVYLVGIWHIFWVFGIFLGYLVHFVAVWYILWLFGIFCGHLVFIPFWYFVPSKIWQPCPSSRQMLRGKPRRRSRMSEDRTFLQNLGTGVNVMILKIISAKKWASLTQTTDIL